MRRKISIPRRANSVDAVNLWSVNYTFDFIPATTCYKKVVDPVSKMVTVTNHSATTFCVRPNCAYCSKVILYMKHRTKLNWFHSMNSLWQKFPEYYMIYLKKWNTLNYHIFCRLELKRLSFLFEIGWRSSMNVIQMHNRWNLNWMSASKLTELSDMIS